jgi:gag-polypeptide of LTR copia-type/Zinc knuckle
MDRMILQTVPILKDSQDFFVWQHKVKKAAAVAGVLGHINGTVDIPDPITAEYRNAETLAQAIASYNLSDDLTAMTMDCESAAEIFRKIENHFKAVSQANKAALRRKFTRVELKTTVMDLATEIRKLAFQLRSAGENISDDDMTSTLLSALESHSKYSVLVTTLDNQVGLTFEVVTNRLLHEEAKSSYDSKNDEALHTSTKRTVKNSKGGTRKCFNCEKVGHIARDCWSKKRGNNADRGNASGRGHGRKFSGRETGSEVF